MCSIRSYFGFHHLCRISYDIYAVLVDAAAGWTGLCSLSYGLFMDNPSYKREFPLKLFDFPSQHFCLSTACMTLLLDAVDCRTNWILSSVGQPSIWEWILLIVVNFHCRSVCLQFAVLCEEMEQCFFLSVLFLWVEAGLSSCLGLSFTWFTFFGWMLST